MSSSLISIALCTYNGSRYVQEQLQSIESQNRSPDEMVICDDGSSDNTLDILHEFAARAAFPVRVLANEKTLGVAQNFARAITLCQGDVIMLCDQDDVWKPHKTQSLLQALQINAGAVYAFSDAEMVGEDGAPLGQKLWDAVTIRDRIPKFHGPRQVETLLRHNLIPGASMALRSSFREVFLPIPSGWMHDYWFALLGSSLAFGVPVEDSLFMYRRHSEQVCGWKKKTYLQVVKDSLRAQQDESWGKLSTFHQLLERTSSGIVPVERERLTLLQDKALHLERRAQIRSRVGADRLVCVAREVLSGRYRRFSDSWQSIVRDVLEAFPSQSWRAQLR
jgi:glycosyltransferase involved in cell wall biosynthesis